MPVQKRTSKKGAAKKTTRKRVTRKPSQRASTAKKKAAFLEAFSQVGNVGLACKVAEIGRQTHYDWLERDEKYAQMYEDAKNEATDILELEAFRRAHDGVNEPALNKGVPTMVPCDTSGGYLPSADHEDFDHYEPFTIKKYSDTLLIFLLKGLRPEKFRERIDQRISGPDGAPLKLYAGVDPEAV